MRILVTGGSGQLGQDVLRAGDAREHDVVALGSQALDVTDSAMVDEVMAAVAPDAVIHCAAYTAVDAAEEERERAFLVNEGGTANVARASEACGAYLVAVSTDYVFRGEAESGYAEDDPPDPINVYGASKLAAERAALKSPGAAVARTAWLFGEHGANFVSAITRLAHERDSIDVVTDQVGSPTWTRHLADALIVAAEQRIPGVMHMGGTPVASWFDVASEVVAALGSSCEVRPTTADSFPRPAARPAWSILRSTRPEVPAVGDWREGVRVVCDSIQLRS